MPGWYDYLQKFKPEDNPLNIEEDRIGILMAAYAVKELILEESKIVPSNKIILGGMGQGGALAIHAGLRHKEQLAGVLSIAGYVPLLNEYPKFVSKANKNTKVFSINGFEDTVVLMQLFN